MLEGAGWWAHSPLFSKNAVLTNDKVLFLNSKFCGLFSYNLWAKYHEILVRNVMDE